VPQYNLGWASVCGCNSSNTNSNSPTRKVLQASTQFWLEQQLELKITGPADLALKAVNSPFEALNSARGAPDRAQ